MPEPTRDRRPRVSSFAGERNKLAKVWQNIELLCSRDIFSLLRAGGGGDQNDASNVKQASNIVA